MYLPNKYTTWYNQIITSAQQRINLSGYTERHHIIPRCLGGSNYKFNLVNLSAREHFICHWLLTKMVPNEYQKKIDHAFWRMLVKGSDYQYRYRPNSRTYESLRKKYGTLRKGIITPDSVKEKISKANKGSIPWNKGVPRTAEEREKMSRNRKKTAEEVGVWNQGKQHSPETLIKIATRAKSRTKYTCPYCNKEVAGSNYYRWHGNNCRSNRL